MRIIYGLVLSTIYILSFVISYKKYKDIFSPLCFYSVIQLISYVPGIMFFKSHFNYELDEINTFYVFVMQVIVLLFVVSGTKLYNEIIRKKINVYAIKYKFNINFTQVGIVLYILGLISAIYYIIINGGVLFIIKNTYLNYATGKSYLYSLNVLMLIGILCMYENKQNINRKIIYILLGIYIANFMIFTKRAPILESIMLVLMLNHYKYKQISVRSIFRPKVIIAIFVLSFIVVILPTLRSTQGFSTYASLSELLITGLKKIGNVFEEYSYVSRDAFIYTNFNMDNMYYGKTIINLLIAPLPSSFFPWKPPVDDGMYLANFMGGYYVLPPSNILPIYNSLPFSSQGSLYANFGIVGIIVGSLCIGILYAYMYKVLRDTNYNVFIIFIYQTIIYKLEFSAKNITQSIIPIAMVIIFVFIPCGVKLIKKVDKTKEDYLTFDNSKKG